MAGERGAGRDDPRGHAGGRARRSSRPSRVGRRVRCDDSGHDRRGGPARRIEPVRRREARGLPAGERGRPVGRGHGRCPRLQSDRSRDASDVPAGTSRAAAARRGGRWRARGRARAPGRRPGLRRPSRRGDGRHGPGDRPEPGSPCLQRRERPPDDREGPRRHDRRSAGIRAARSANRRRHLRDRTTSAARSPTPRASVRRDGCRPSSSRSPSMRSSPVSRSRTDEPDEAAARVDVPARRRDLGPDGTHHPRARRAGSPRGPRRHRRLSGRTPLAPVELCAGRSPARPGRNLRRELDIPAGRDGPRLPRPLPRARHPGPHLRARRLPALPRVLPTRHAQAPAGGGRVPSGAAGDARGLEPAWPFPRRGWRRRCWVPTLDRSSFRPVRHRRSTWRAARRRTESCTSATRACRRMAPIG